MPASDHRFWDVLSMVVMGLFLSVSMSVAYKNGFDMKVDPIVIIGAMSSVGGVGAVKRFVNKEAE